MPLPLTDLYRDGLSSWQRCTELAALDPDRTVFWGCNPLEGKKALDDITRQVEEFGAKGFKFYNVRYEDGGPVLADGRPEGRVPRVRAPAEAPDQPHRGH